MTTPTDVKHLFNEDQITSANAYFDCDIDGEFVRVQLTARFGSSAQTIADQATALIEGFRLARQKFPRPDGGKTLPAEQPAQTGGKYEPKPVDKLPEGLPEGMEAFKEDFDEIEITPAADNKVSVIFYRDGMKYPVGARINKWKNDNAAQILNPLGEFDLTKAAKVRSAGTQYYTKGNEYVIANGAHKGEKSHYKDLRLIEARF